MLTILHNPRCRKSREGLAILEKSGREFEVREYLKDPLTGDELNNILSQLKLSAKDIIRTSETIWKENYKHLEMSPGNYIQAMANHPILIERPIVYDGTNAVVGRPPENIENLLA